MESNDQHHRFDEDKQKQLQKEVNKIEETGEGIETSTDEMQITEDTNASTSDVAMASTSSGANGRKSNGIVQKINEKSQNVCRKLQMRKDCLQKRKQEIKDNNAAARVNDIKASKVLEKMGVPKLNKCSSPKASISSRDEVCTETEKALLVRTLKGQSHKQLGTWILGLQELVSKLTMDDMSLKSKARHLAVNISNLKNFPFFLNVVENLPSTSQQARARNYYGELMVQENTISSTSKNTTTQKSDKKQNKTIELPPSEKLLNYINSMLADYLGDQQSDKLEKLKCNATYLEDLEKYAQTLAQEGLGRVVEEEIRVNRKNNRQAFITLSNDREALDRDGIVTLPVARRYAFDGDIVRAFIMLPNTISQNNDDGGKKIRRISSNIMGGKDNSICLGDDEDLLDECDSSPDTDNEDSPDNTAIVSDNCPKAFVIGIVKQTELREVVGSIDFKKTVSLNSRNYYKLKPHDMRVPMVYVAADSCQDHVKAVNKDDVVGMLYLSHILETDNNGYCFGELLQPVGKVGNLEAEIKAILIHNGMKDLKPYDQKFYDMYDGPMLPVTAEDLKHREDLRKKCVFTIDPLTARDLDDAVSIEKISDDEYEIGVHISDVSHYLEENSELDNLVKLRATSVYLVNEVIHMLPTSLCFRCSLLPGEDKFAFSVFWRWNDKTQVMDNPRFTRSVINSCSQFAYEHAQKIIDNPEESFGSEDFPEILNNFTPSDIKWRVLLLQSISQKLRAKRYESGALSINNPKIRFSLDPVTGEPVSYAVEERLEANFLIEEFMLLANQAVAKFIHQHFPETSILRNHAPPIPKSMKALKERLANLNLDFDISTSKTIYESMQRLCSQATDPVAMDACLSTLLTKPMARARYYCSDGRSEELDFWHYALSIPIYTHFTSPIRRYPDILVHRSLAAALNYCKPPQRTVDELHQLAKICNDQKFNAKNAGDESIDHFFVRYIRAKESITLNAVVTDIFRHMLNVVTIETGHSFAIAHKSQKVVIDATHAPSYVLVSEKNSQRTPMKLQLFSTVVIKIVLRKNKTCAFLETPDKTQRRINSKESSKMRENQINNTSNNTANGFHQNNHTIMEQEEASEISRKTSRAFRKNKLKARQFALKAVD